MITVSQLQTIFPKANSAYADALSEAWQRFGIVTRSAKAAFMGVTGNETGGYVATGREDMRYSPERAFELFPKAREFPVICADRCAKGDRAFASWIYANLYGNGGEETYDGWNFRGGGPIQITFRSTYEACGRAIGVNLAGDPNQIVQPRVGALAAAWFVSVYKPTVLKLFDTGSDEDFLAGARMVGWPEPAAVRRRLTYRAEAYKVVVGNSATSAKLKILDLDDVGDEVTAVQKALGLEPTGVFDVATEIKVKAFQRMHWPASPYEWDGVVGARTWAALGLP